jgi:heptosyltransferase-3
VKLPDFQHILVTRTDRIGDVILALPMIAALHAGFEKAGISMLLREYTRDLAEGQEGLTGILTEDRNGRRKPFFEMLDVLRNERFDAAIIAYPRFRIALLVWLAGIPFRVGTGYRWYSFLFNRRVYEHRKTVEKHEAEYNLSLIHAAGCALPARPQVRLAISAMESIVRSVRQSLGVTDADRLALLHPGSGGSARDWKPENFSKLAVLLFQKGFRVIITGGAGDRSLVEKVSKETGGTATPFISTLGLRAFGAFIHTAKIFIANSTGPLHIAAAVGTPVIGFFPALRVMSPKRWGPLTDKKVIFVPDPSRCPRCRGGTCRGNECMEQIEVHEVAEAALKLTADPAIPERNRSLVA